MNSDQRQQRCPRAAARLRVIRPQLQRSGLRGLPGPGTRPPECVLRDSEARERFSERVSSWAMLARGPGWNQVLYFDAIFVLDPDLINRARLGELASGLKPLKFGYQGIDRFGFVKVVIETANVESSERVGHFQSPLSYLPYMTILPMCCLFVNNKINYFLRGTYE